MKKLLAYLNGLSQEEQLRFASACETSIGYLRKACSKGQLLGTVLCVAIERESNKSVTRKDLHPDDWVSHWPELQQTTKPKAPL